MNNNEMSARDEIKSELISFVEGNDDLENLGRIWKENCGTGTQIIWRRLFPD